MQYLLLFSLLLWAYAEGAALERPDEGAEEADTYLEPLEIIKKYGYPAESHQVQTDDGYILTLHRIPYGRLCSAEKSRGPVLVQHGLFSSSVDWFVIGTKRGLPYILADNCYDVWLGNSRGNTYSREHAYLDNKSSEYWDFSWHEMGVYDIPAVVDYILHVSQKKDLLYIGHSQGTTQFFIFNSMHPEYKEKVRAAFLLAPIAFFKETDNPLLRTIAQFQGVLGWIADNIGLNQFLPHNDLITNVGGAICSEMHPNLEAMCANIVFIGCGFDSEELNMTMLPIYLGHIPAGCATKQLLHYAQSFNSGKFQYYDYGHQKNKELYGQKNPPDYDLSKVTIPTHLHYSNNDKLSAVEDVQNLRSLLGNVAGSHLVPREKFNHLDYVIATDVVELLYDPLLALMDKY